MSSKENANVVTRFKTEYAVAFLDLLGFKSFVKEDFSASLELLQDIQQVVTTAIDDAVRHPPESYEDEELARVANDNMISSFDLFLPISDSVIVLSGNPSLMVRQLSNLVAKCFNFTSSVYSSAREGKDPSEIVIPTVRLGKRGQVEVDESPTHWYPKLFRGGISFGEVTRISSSYSVGSQTHNFLNIAGQPYVEATVLERCKLKGPRLFCNKSLVDQLEESEKRFVVQTEIEVIYEVLWPVFQFSEIDDPDILRNEFAKHYEPVKALSEYYAGHRSAEHYHQFEILWARSTIAFFDAIGASEIGKALVRNNFGLKVQRELSHNKSRCKLSAWLRQNLKIS